MPWFKKLFGNLRTPGMLKIARAETAGQRKYMEDRHVIMEKIPQFPELALFAVFDGHGGFRASQFAAETIVEVLCQHLVNQNFHSTNLDKISVLEKALHKAFLTIDKNFLAKWVHRRDGSTALVSLIYTPARPANSKVPVRSYLIVANAGDCRAVLSRADAAIPLSVDHKPSRPDERRRVENLGGIVSLDQKGNCWRVEDVLAVSRAIGDAPLKKYVIPDPEIQKIELSSQDSFFLMASDGLWDVFQDQEAIDWVGERLEEGANTLHELAEALVQEAEDRGSMDNITAILVKISI